MVKHTEPSNVASGSPETKGNAEATGQKSAEKDWKSALLVDPKSGNILTNRFNLKTILKRSPETQGIRFNDLSGQIEVTDDPIWRNNEYAAGWTSRDTVSLLSYFTDEYYCEFSKSEVEDMVLAVAVERRYNPVIDYIENLPPWDKVPRAKTIFVDYLGAEDTPYVEDVAWKWLLGTMKRIYQPGCKFDYTPIISGPQGIGKSTLIKKLSIYWFSDSINFEDMSDTKRGAEKLQGKWILEIPELKGMRKAEVNAIKSFLTSQVDNYREPYARNSSPHPRMCSFIGTTNDDNFLKDITGGRRFWPVRVSGENVKIKPYNIPNETIDQIWAEVYDTFSKNPDIPLVLDESLEKEAEFEQTQALESDDREGALEAFLDIPLPDDWNNKTINEQQAYIDNYPSVEGTNRRMQVTIPEIWNIYFQNREANRNKQDSMAISAMLKRLSWKPDKKCKVAHFGKQRVYIRNE